MRSRRQIGLACSRSSGIATARRSTSGAPGLLWQTSAVLRPGSRARGLDLRMKENHTVIAKRWIDRDWSVSLSDQRTAILKARTRAFRFPKGQSGNPSGQSRFYHEARKIARRASPQALRDLVELSRTAEDERVRAICLVAVCTLAARYGVAIILPATRPCAQRPPEALPPRGRKIRGKRAAKLSFHAATRA